MIIKAAEMAMYLRAKSLKTAYLLTIVWITPANER